MNIPGVAFPIMEHQISLTTAWFSALEPHVTEDGELRTAFELAKESRANPVGLRSFYRVYCTTHAAAILLGIAEIFCHDAVQEIMRSITSPLF